MRHFLALLVLFGLVCSVRGEGSLYKTTTPLPEGRQMYGTAALNGWLYVIGGNGTVEGYLGTVVKAPIRPDGTLGDWSLTTPLPNVISYIHNTTLVENGRLYIVGGLMADDKTRYRRIIWSAPGTDGELGPWQVSEDHPGSGVSCAVAVSTRNHLHLIGGSIGASTPTDAVWSAELDGDGAVTGWKEAPKLPVPLWFHSAGVVGDRVYLWSGLTTKDPSSASKAIYTSTVGGDGTLGPWHEEQARLPEAFYSGSCTVSGNILLSFCTRDSSSNPTGDIWYAQVLPQGLSAWARREEGIPACHYIAVGTDRSTGTVYLPGGRKSKADRVLDPTVYYFKLAQKQSSPAAAAARPTPPPPSPPPPAAAPAQPAPPARASAGFLGYTEGVAEAQRTGRPMVIYFHRPGDENCRVQADELKVRPFEPYADSLIFIHVDAQATPEIASKYEVTRVPAWIFTRKPDTVATRVDRVMQPEELKLALGLLAQK